MFFLICCLVFIFNYIFMIFFIISNVILIIYSIIKSIRNHNHNNFFKNIKETKFWEGTLEIFKDISSRYLIIIIPAIIFFSIINLIFCSGTIVQIGSIFDPYEFTAKYQANIKVIDNGDLSAYHTLLNIDGETVEAVVEKNENTYQIKLIEYKNYILIDNSDEDKNKYNRDEIKKGFKFTPIEVYRNGKNCTPYDEYTGYYDKLPTFKVTLSDVLIEKSSSKDFTGFYFFGLISYISFMCILVIYLTWVVYNIKESKLATIITFIISLIISTLLVVIPMKYTLPSVQNNVSKSYDLLTENSTLSYRNSYSSSRTYRDNDNENATSHTVKRNGAYLLNPDSMKIHTCYCHTIKHKENFIKTTDYEEAIEEGYEPCQVCKPE